MNRTWTRIKYTYKKNNEKKERKNIMFKKIKEIFKKKKWHCDYCKENYPLLCPIKGLEKDGEDFEKKPKD